MMAPVWVWRPEPPRVPRRPAPRPWWLGVLHALAAPAPA